MKRGKPERKEIMSRSVCQSAVLVTRPTHSFMAQGRGKGTDAEWAVWRSCNVDASVGCAAALDRDAEPVLRPELPWHTSPP